MAATRLPAKLMNNVDAFAAVAEEYCAWAEGESLGEIADARTARKLLAELIRHAIELPDPSDELSSDAEPEAISSEDYQRIFRRFGSLPFNYYSECFDPLVVPGEEPVTSDLADDLADIWGDLESGLSLHRAGHVDAAAFHWKYHFDIHWAHHATSALYALQCWFSEHHTELREPPHK